MAVNEIWSSGQQLDALPLPSTCLVPSGQRIGFRLVMAMAPRVLVPSISQMYIYLLIFVPLLELHGSIIQLSGNFLCHVVCRDNVKSAQELLTNQV